MGLYIYLIIFDNRSGKRYYWWSIIYLEEKYVCLGSDLIVNNLYLDCKCISEVKSGQTQEFMNAAISLIYWVEHIFAFWLWNDVASSNIDILTVDVYI